MNIPLRILKPRSPCGALDSREWGGGEAKIGITLMKTAHSLARAKPGVASGGGVHTDGQRPG